MTFESMIPEEFLKGKDFLLLRNNKRFIFISTYVCFISISRRHPSWWAPDFKSLVTSGSYKAAHCRQAFLLHKYSKAHKALKITFRKLNRSASNFSLRPKNPHKATRTENILPHIAIVLMVIKTSRVCAYGGGWKKSLSEIFNGIITSYKSNKQWSRFNETRFHFSDDFLWKLGKAFCRLVVNSKRQKGNDNPL